MERRCCCKHGSTSGGEAATQRSQEAWCFRFAAALLAGGSRACRAATTAAAGAATGRHRRRWRWRHLHQQSRRRQWQWQRPQQRLGLQQAIMSLCLTRSWRDGEPDIPCMRKRHSVGQRCAEMPNQHRQLMISRPDEERRHALAGSPYAQSRTECAPRRSFQTASRHMLDQQEPQALASAATGGESRAGLQLSRKVPWLDKSQGGCPSAISHTRRERRQHSGGSGVSPPARGIMAGARCMPLLGRCLSLINPAVARLRR